jgi:hypothetical protein
MKTIIILLSFFISSCNSKVNTMQQTPLTEYPVAVSFGSICCGTPDPAFLKTFISNYNRENNSNVTADIVAGCGREGEFVILINPGALEAGRLQSLINSLQEVVTATDSRNKAGNSSSGTLELLKNVKTDQFSFCRIALKKWL